MFRFRNTFSKNKPKNTFFSKLKNFFSKKKVKNNDFDDNIYIPETGAAITGGAGGYDIGAIAEQHGSTPVQFIDDRLINPADGTLKELDPATTQARENAGRLGNAAAAAVLDRTTREAGTYHAAAEEKTAEYDGSQTELIALTKNLVQCSAVEQWLLATPDSTRPTGSKFFSWAAKPICFLGDTCVIAGSLYVTGAPMFAAVATGLSASAGAVCAGSVAGHNAAVAYKRDRRGAAPDKCPDVLADLYKDPDDGDKTWSIWCWVGAGFTTVLGFGVMTIGIGAGIAPVEAMGTGLLSALTVAGSAAAEAYATNPAADRLDKYRSKRENFAAAIGRISQLRAAAQALFTSAATIRAAGPHEARAAFQTTIVVSLPNDPRTFGYLSPMPAESARLELPTTLPAIVEPPSVDATPALMDTTDLIGDINKVFAHMTGPDIGAPPVPTGSQGGHDDDPGTTDGDPASIPAMPPIMPDPGVVSSNGTKR
jgi:hypothetical protein